MLDDNMGKGRNRTGKGNVIHTLMGMWGVTASGEGTIPSENSSLFILIKSH